MQKVLLVSAWREAANVFNEEKKLLFKITEEVTLIHLHGLSDETWFKAIEVFGEALTGQIIMTVIAINAWNSISVAAQLHLSVRGKTLQLN